MTARDKTTKILKQWQWQKTTTNYSNKLLIMHNSKMVQPLETNPLFQKAPELMGLVIATLYLDVDDALIVDWF